MNDAADPSANSGRHSAIPSSSRVSIPSPPSLTAISDHAAQISVFRQQLLSSRIETRLRLQLPDPLETRPGAEEQIQHKWFDCVEQKRSADAIPLHHIETLANLGQRRLNQSGLSKAKKPKKARKKQPAGLRNPPVEKILHPVEWIQIMAKTRPKCCLCSLVE